MQHSAPSMTQPEKDRLLDEWMRDFGDDIFRLCFIILQDRMLAEDASQEVFIKAYKRADTLRQREYTNTCRDIRRSAWLRHIDQRVALEDLPPAVCDFTPADDSVVREIMSLAPKYREALLLHYYQDMSAEDCAKALHLTVSGFYRRLKRAQAQLKTQLERWGFDESE